MTIFGIDFDGTVVTHEFPKVGKDIGAVPVLKALVEQGHQLILFTMRSDFMNPESKLPQIKSVDGRHLTVAVEWFRKNGIPLYGINKNPTQHEWTKSPKAYAELYIDDAGLGCPLKFDPKLSKRPFVDWEVVKRILIDRGFLNHTV